MVLLSQSNEVVALDIVQEKVDLINERKSPIEDTEIEKFFSDKKPNLRATTSKSEVSENADYVTIATPTDYDPHQIRISRGKILLPIQSSPKIRGWQGFIGLS